MAPLQNPTPARKERFLPYFRFDLKKSREHFFLLFCLLFAFQSKAQSTYYAQDLSEKISLHNYAIYANAGKEEIDFEKVRNNTADLDFQPLGSSNVNIGFTSDYYWVKFQMANRTSEYFTYYLETARPITDHF